MKTFLHHLKFLYNFLINYKSFKTKKMKKVNFILALLCVMLCVTSCQYDDGTPATPVSASGVKQATAVVQTDANGQTTEQINILKKLKVDNAIGSIKHLYIISAYSGQVLIYSTVSGKVTSSGKRLTPTTVIDHQGQDQSNAYGFDVNIGGKNYRTTEVLQDDGTHGSSIEYLYWFDTRGIYHQQYVTGGMVLHISDQPLAVKNIVINMELTNEK